MITTLTGKNSFALQTMLRQLVSTVENEVGELGIERLDAGEKEVDVLLQAVQSLPFLVSKKLVVLNNIQSNSGLLDRMDELIDRTAEGVDVVIVEPALDKRKSTYKLLQKQSNLHNFAEPRVQELPTWVVDFAKQKDATITLNNATYLVDRIGVHQQLLASEVEKLALYSNKITRESIDLLTDQSLQSTVFSLLDAAFTGDSARAITLYREQRRARIEPHYIVAMLVWQLQAVAQAVYANPKTETSLTAVGQSSFSARKSLSMAKNLTRADVKKWIVELCQLDLMIKSSADPDAGLELYLLNLKPIS